MTEPFPSKYAGGFNNNLDFARLVFASAVIFLHFYHLTPSTSVTTVIGWFGFITGNAVAAFFVVSGFVVFMSYDYNRNLKLFFISRTLRLYPAYFVVIALCAFGFFAVSSLDAKSYFDWEFARYLEFNLIFLNFLQPSIHDVFSSNYYSGVVNGALWSLKTEVAFYCIVPFLHWAISRFRFVGVLIIYTVGQVAKFFNDDIAALVGISAESLSHQLPAQLPLFASGIFIYLYYNTFRRHWKSTAVFAAACLLIGVQSLHELAFSFVIIGLFVNGFPLIRFSRLGDISYGVYIYHFPIIQLIVYFEFLSAFPFLRLLAVVSLTFCAAIVSHRYIEIPAIRLKVFYKAKGTGICTAS